MQSTQFPEREYTVDYRTGDTVCSDDIPPHDSRREHPATPEEAAIYGVERLLDRCGPDAFAVDVTDEEGITHRFDVYRWHGKWCCDRRDAPEDVDADSGGAA